MAAPVASAPYSRLREMAICTIMAASGAMIIIANATIGWQFGLALLC